MSQHIPTLSRALPPLRRGGQEWADENVGLQPFPVPSSFVVRHLPPLIRGGQGGWRGETADSACGLSYPASLAIGPAPSPPLAPPYQGGETLLEARRNKTSGDRASNPVGRGRLFNAPPLPPLSNGGKPLCASKRNNRRRELGLNLTIGRLGQS